MTGSPRTEFGIPQLWWCLKCGICWTAPEAPICRHNALDLPAAVMVPLPSYHPMHPESRYA